MTPQVETFRRTRPLLQGVVENQGTLAAFLEFDASNNALIADLSSLEEDGVVEEFRQHGTLVHMKPLPAQGRLDLKVDLGKLDSYFETYNSLIAAHPNEPPSEFIVWADTVELRAGYASACEFLQVLKRKAEVWDPIALRYFFVDQQTLEIPLTYQAQQTMALPKSLPDVVRFLDDALPDADARWPLFRKAALRVIGDLSKEQRLGVLMERLGVVFERAKQDHSLYLERFDFDKLLKIFDEQRLKFVGDLNQVLASIQTALIAVPIGFFLIAEKFEPGGRWLGQNIILAAGGIVFFALLYLISLNQGKTLESVKLALDDFEADQNKKVTDQFERLGKLLTSTRNQYSRVRWLLWTVRILLVSFSLIIVAALLWCSIPALQQRLPYSAPAGNLQAKQESNSLQPVSTKSPSLNAPRLLNNQVSPGQDWS